MATTTPVARLAAEEASGLWGAYALPRLERRALSRRVSARGRDCPPLRITILTTKCLLDCQDCVVAVRRDAKYIFT